jgi:hypothetical protein
MASVVFAILLVLDLQRAGAIGTPVAILIGSTGLLFLSLFVTGALLSIDKLASAALRAVHTAIPFLAMACTGLLGCLRLRNGM